MIEDFSPFKKQLNHIIWSVEKKTESKNPKVSRTKNGRIMLLSNYAVGNSKKSKFIKQQGSNGLVSSLGIKIF